MQTVTRLLALFCAALALNVAAQPSKTPGQQAYETVQALRQEANPIVNAKAPDATRKAIGMFEEALKILDKPEVVESANGDVSLRFRRFDVELDLAQAYAQLGDANAAFDHLEKASHVASLGGSTAFMLKIRPGLAPLRDDPRFQALMRKSEAVDRLWFHPDIGTPYSETLTPEQRIAGLSLFWQEVGYNFAWFDRMPELNWDTTYQSFVPQVLAAQTTRDYYDVLMRLAPLLHDGHTNIYPPKELESHFYSRPPMRTAFVEGRVIVRNVRSATLEKSGVHVGDEIVAIDGQPVREYAERHVRPYQSSSTPQDSDVRTYEYGLLAGDSAAPIALTLRDARGGGRTVQVSRGHYDDAKPPPPESLSDLGDGIVYLSLTEFEDDASVKIFEQALPQILKAKGLILDLRDNGGGSTSYGLQILSYLSHQPIPTMVSRMREYSPAPRTSNAASIQWQTFGSDAYSQKRGHVFDGAVALLIGPRTFSAGEDFVASFQMLQRGLLIGAATAGSTGQPLTLKLPGGGTARICVKRDEYPDGGSFVGIGIVPDIQISETIADVRAGKDRALERAKREMLKPSR